MFTLIKVRDVTTAPYSKPNKHPISKFTIVLFTPEEAVSTWTPGDVHFKYQKVILNSKLYVFLNAHTYIKV